MKKNLRQPLSRTSAFATGMTLSSWDRLRALNDWADEWCQGDEERHPGSGSNICVWGTENQLVALRKAVDAGLNVISVSFGSLRKMESMVYRLKLAGFSVIARASSEVVVAGTAEHFRRWSKMRVTGALGESLLTEELTEEELAEWVYDWGMENGSAVEVWGDFRLWRKMKKAVDGGLFVASLMATEDEDNEDGFVEGEGDAYALLMLKLRPYRKAGIKVLQVCDNEHSAEAVLSGTHEQFRSFHKSKVMKSLGDSAQVMRNKVKVSLGDSSKWVVRAVLEATSRRDFLKMLSGAAAGVAGATALGEVPADPTSDSSSSFWFRTCGMCGEYSNSPLKRGMRAVNLDPKTYRAGRGYLRGTPAFGMEPTIGRFSDNVGICSRCWSLMDKYWRNRSRLRKKLDIPLKTWAQRKLPHTFTSNDRGEYDYDDVVRGVSEARSQPGESVEGLDRFIKQMELAQGDLMTPGLIADIRAFINKSGCPKIKFEQLSGALGISTSNECVVSSQVLGSSMTQLLYVIFHELAHQYQYSKHGEDFAGEIYLGDKPALESAKDLLKIENIADRYAHRIVKHLMDRHKLKFEGIRLVYKNLSPTAIAGHVSGLRSMVKRLGLTNVEDVNEYIYNMVKASVSTRTR